MNGIACWLTWRMAAVWPFPWHGIRGYYMDQMPSVGIGNCSGMVTPSNGQTLTNTLELKDYSPGDAVAKVKRRSLDGLLRAVDVALLIVLS